MRLISAFLLAASLTFAGGQAAHAARYGVAATVGDREISEPELQNALNNYLRQNGIEVGAIRQPGDFKEIRSRVLTVLIEQELLWQAAVDSGNVASETEITREMERIRAQFDDDLSFDNRIREGGYTRSQFRRQLKHRLSAQKWISANVDVNVDDSEVEQFYNENRQQFAIPERVRASHILLKLDPQSSDEEKNAAREQLLEIKQRIDDGADFAALAREYSEDNSASQGGDLGYFGRGQMVASFERVAFSLAPGETSNIVETRYGLHLIRVADRKPASYYALEDVADRVRQHLYRQKYQASIQAAVDDLKQQTSIEVYN